VFDPIEAVKEDAPRLWPDGNISDPEGKPFLLEYGDVEKALREADVVVQGTFKNPMIVHTPLEPHACVASWDGDRLTTWISTQTPHACRNPLASYFEIPVSSVRVISDYVGGGFGGKYVEKYPFIAALLSKKTGKPVKLEFTRQQVHTISRKRYGAISQVKMGAKRDGTLVALDFQCYYDVGACGNAVGGSCLYWESMPYVYRYRNARFKSWDVNTNLITAQPFRAVELPAYHFAIEQMLDMLAEKLDLSPVEIRIKNTRRTGEILEPYGQVLSDYPIEECIKKTIAAIKWNEKWKGWRKPQTSTNKKVRGIGIATSMGWGNWVPDTTSAMVKVEVDGSATLFIGTQDIGTGSKTTLCQIVAEVLGLRIEDVNIVTGDTSATPSDGGCFASRTLVTGGRAAKMAAQDAREKILEKASIIFGVGKEELSIDDRKIFIRKESDGIPISEILTGSVTGAHSQELPEQAAPLRDKVKLGGALAHAAEVEVDLETGKVNILNYVAVHDVGRAINPLVVQNQICGGVIMGLGATISEALVFDPKKRVYLNPDYTDYKILTIGDIPPIQPIIMESHEPTGPFGAKGIGEQPNVLPPAVIANAVYDATSFRVMELPITPENVLKTAATSHS
jgi:xanthine dehydrogenase molybdenum-binding subunit